MYSKEANFKGKLHNTSEKNPTFLHLHPLSFLFSKRKDSLGRPINLSTKSKSSSNLSAKNQILTWFLHLSETHLIASTRIYNLNFIQPFLKNYANNPKHAVHLPTSRILPYSPSGQVISSPAILNMLRYAHISQPQLYFSWTSKTSQMIVDWLETISNKQVFHSTPRSINKQNPQQNLLWFNSHSFHNLDQWLANQLEKNILRYYYHKNDQFFSIKSLRKHMESLTNANSKHFHYLQMKLSELNSQFFKYGAKTLEQMRQYQESYAIEIQTKIVNIQRSANKPKKHRRKHKKQRKNIQKSERQNQDHCQHVSQSQNPERTLPLVEENKDCQVYQQKSMQNTTVSHVQIQDQIQENKPQFSKEKPQIQHFEYSQQKEISQPQYFSQNLEQYDHTFTQTCESNEGLQMNESATQNTEAKKRKKRKRNHKNTTNIYQQFKNKAMKSLINKKFNSFVDDLNYKSNSLYQSKIIAFERVKYFINMVNPHIQSILFGSNAVGISLPTSDIDIMLLGLQSLSKEQICDYLAQIAIFINAMGWVISCSTYLNAKVPLLKLQIDTSVSYAKPKVKLDYQQTTDPYLSYYLDLRDVSKGSIIKVDITISVQEGSSSASTELMRNWLVQKPSIQRIILAFKYILSIRGYNQNFKGGIGSYSLFIMIAAYFQHFKEERQNENCQIFLDILQFYGQDFQNQIKIISISLDHQKNKCFLTHEEYSQELGSDLNLNYQNSLRIIDPLNKKLISSSFSQYNYIKAEWRRIRLQILKMQEKVQDEIYSCFANLNDLNKILSNQKSYEKWINKAYNRIDFSITNILHGIN